MESPWVSGHCKGYSELTEHGPLVYLTIEENGQIRKKKYLELTEQEKLQDDCDVQATNIILQGLLP
nr:hypothetical protein [Tanacetum cinerariifolium]